MRLHRPPHDGTPGELNVVLDFIPIRNRKSGREPRAPHSRKSGCQPPLIEDKSLSAESLGRFKTT